MTIPTIDCDRVHPTLAVRDVLAAVEYYTTHLGFTTGFTWGEPATMAGVNLGSVQLFLAHGAPPADGTMVAFVVGDADALYAHHQANGVAIVEPIADRDYGLRDYAVRDRDGHRLSFGHDIYSAGPTIEIDRVDVPVRLESRLAAVLTDLAARKRMTISSVLEETLLHTFDGVGPHTPADLRAIAELKERHGIDYDTHGSYRFRERSVPKA